MAEGKIKVQPTGGKYLNVNVDNVDYDIYLVDPRTGEQGTEIPRSIAIRLLSYNTPLISVVPVVENGVYVNQFTPDELEEIKYLKNNPRDGRKYTERKEQESDAQSVAQEKLIANQEKMISEKDDEIAKLKAELAKAKKSKKVED